MGKGAHGSGGGGGGGHSGGHSGDHSGGGGHHHHHHHHHRGDHIRGSLDCAVLAGLLVCIAVLSLFAGVLESAHGVVWKTVVMLFVMLLAVLCMTMYCCCLRAGCFDDEQDGVEEGLKRAREARAESGARLYIEPRSRNGAKKEISSQPAECNHPTARSNTSPQADLLKPLTSADQTTHLRNAMHFRNAQEGYYDAVLSPPEQKPLMGGETTDDEVLVLEDGAHAEQHGRV